MRTRSQPISPSGFQSLDSAPRKRKTQSAAVPKTAKTTKQAGNKDESATASASATAPKTAKTAKTARQPRAKVEKKTAGKRGAKKPSKEETAAVAEHVKEEEVTSFDTNNNGNVAPAEDDNKCEQRIFSSSPRPFIPSPADSGMRLLNSPVSFSVSGTQTVPEDHQSISSTPLSRVILGSSPSVVQPPASASGPSNAFNFGSGYDNYPEEHFHLSPRLVNPLFGALGSGPGNTPPVLPDSSTPDSYFSYFSSPTVPSVAAYRRPLGVWRSREYLRAARNASRAPGNVQPTPTAVPTPPSATSAETPLFCSMWRTAPQDLEDFTPTIRVPSMPLAPMVPSVGGFASRISNYLRPTSTSPLVTREPMVNSAQSPMVTSVGTQTAPSFFSKIARCPCCSMALVWPKNHNLRRKNLKPLTKLLALSQKRGRQDSSDDDDQLPTPKKRRDAAPPAVARHRQRRVTPYAERTRRRAIESQGRIDKTIFRIPQLIAQNKADRDVPDNDNSDSFEEPDWDVLNQMRADAAALEEELPQSPEPPQIPTRRWDLRSLINSVPRSISRLLPTVIQSPTRTFNRSPNEGTDSSTDLFMTPPELFHRPMPSPQSQTPQQVEQAEQSDQSLDAAHYMNDSRFSYSLFPQPLNRRQLLGIKSPEEPSPQKEADQAPRTEPAATIETVDQTVDNNTQHESQDNNNSDRPEKKRKRKREPSPDEIPNPPGVSYGMDLRYFEFSSSEFSSSEAEGSTVKTTTVSGAEQARLPISNTSQPPLPTPRQPAIRGILRGTKRVRFDSSPENTPSKLRLRNSQAQATDDNQHSPERQAQSPERQAQSPEGQAQSPTYTDDPMDTSDSSLTGRSPTAASDPQPSGSSPPIIRPNPYGTYCLDYSLFSSDSDEEDEDTSESAAASSSRTETTADQAPEASTQPAGSATSLGTPSTVKTDEPSGSRGVSQPLTTASSALPGSSTAEPLAPSNTWTQPPPPRPTPAHASLPPQPTTPAEPDAIAKLRSQAEKYKPRLPSGLRASRRYSSSPLSAVDESLPKLNARPPAARGAKTMRELVEERWDEEEDGRAADEIFGREWRRFRRDPSRFIEWEEEGA
ncbi:hypothetical protein AJ79_04516 [Helicocarpus griseus UAMH5409]|uniref:Uncharacterized protein n=1 Tax=Helicocarpus griseus UAMH5409 TaxID=1447875 RepID=A0A2B7XU43_9EURO|nr:hypothetical protein AJ79_04516 [Helicocarpus griseus UAMH5409]